LFEVGEVWEDKDQLMLMRKSTAQSDEKAGKRPAIARTPLFGNLQQWTKSSRNLISPHYRLLWNPPYSNQPSGEGELLLDEKKERGDTPIR